MVNTRHPGRTTRQRARCTLAVSLNAWSWVGGLRSTGGRTRIRCLVTEHRAEHIRQSLLWQTRAGSGRQRRPRQYHLPSGSVPAARSGVCMCARACSLHCRTERATSVDHFERMGGGAMVWRHAVLGSGWIRQPDEHFSAARDRVVAWHATVQQVCVRAHTHPNWLVWAWSTRRHGV